MADYHTTPGGASLLQDRRHPTADYNVETGKLLINEEPLQVLPSLAVLIGLNEAIVVQQLHYWAKRCDNTRDGFNWVYNTYAQWQQQFPFWSESTLRRVFRSLEQPFTPKDGDERPARGPILISTEAYNRMKMDHTKWSRLDYAELSRLNTLACPSVQNEKASGQFEKGPVQNDATSGQFEQIVCSEWTEQYQESTQENTQERGKGRQGAEAPLLANHSTPIDPVGYGDPSKATSGSACPKADPPEPAAGAFFENPAGTVNPEVARWKQAIDRALCAYNEVSGDQNAIGRVWATVSVHLEAGVALTEELLLQAAADGKRKWAAEGKQGRPRWTNCYIDSLADLVAALKAKATLATPAVPDPAAEVARQVVAAQKLREYQAGEARVAAEEQARLAHFRTLDPHSEEFKRDIPKTMQPHFRREWFRAHRPADTSPLALGYGASA